MNQEVSICVFCKEEKRISRHYVYPKNKHFDDNVKGVYSHYVSYCLDCGIVDAVTKRNLKDRRSKTDKKDMALRLRAEGKTLKQIAKIMRYKSISGVQVILKPYK